MEGAPAASRSNDVTASRLTGGAGVLGCGAGLVDGVGADGPAAISIVVAPVRAEPPSACSAPNFSVSISVHSFEATPRRPRSLMALIPWETTNWPMAKFTDAL